MKKLEDMSFKDNFMFTAAMSDEDLCCEVLEVILGITIVSVTVSTEKNIKSNPEFRGVRLDVLAEETGSKRRFDVEMQVEKYPDLPRRCRYYHSQMDLDLLLSGIKYQELPDTFVIFICDYDPVGDKRYKHTYNSICAETGKPMENGQTTILLSSKGEDRTEISHELFLFMQYIRHPEKKNDDSEDRLIQKIKERVQSIKRDREWRTKYMLVEELISMEREKAIKEEKEKRMQAEARLEEVKAKAEAEKAKAEEEIKYLRELLGDSIS